MQKSNPPERVLRLAGVTGLPAHATDTQKVGALQLRGRMGCRGPYPALAICAIQLAHTLRCAAMR
jgi:hypothetical protein